ncbi:MAG TPA: hypothetical protein DEQ30_14070 [Porphyromonadaceae bacterium]|nr:hypothetical protein [Porphyromonadaceae bacterium]
MIFLYLYKATLFGWDNMIGTVSVSLTFCLNFSTFLNTGVDSMSVPDSKDENCVESVCVF